MLTRYLFTAFMEPKHLAAIRDILSSVTIPEDIYTLSFFSFHKRLFFYCEAHSKGITPDTLFPELNPYLSVYPGDEAPRTWIPMLEIFHYNRPVTDEDWIRKQPMRPWIQLVRIKPDKIASYIYYHYQLQEEQPGSGNKYGIIAMHENLLCFYLEDPDTTEGLVFEGSLSTHNTPQDWRSTMEPHFLRWEDTAPDIIWRRDSELLFHYTCSTFTL